MLHYFLEVPWVTGSSRDASDDCAADTLAGPSPCPTLRPASKSGSCSGAGAAGTTSDTAGLGGSGARVPGVGTSTDDGHTINQTQPRKIWMKIKLTDVVNIILT